MNVRLISARPNRRTVWTLAHALLLCVFVWNQYYIPVHLAGHDHTTERNHFAEAFGAHHEEEDEEGHSEEHHSDNHEAHPASDHLSGYIGTWQTPASITIELVNVRAITPALCPELSGTQTAAPPARAPPCFSSSAS